MTNVNTSTNIYWNPMKDPLKNVSVEEAGDLCVESPSVLTRNETIIMWLMPISNVAAWVSLIAIIVLEQPAMPWLCGVGTFYWLWAWKNRIVGPLKSDAGVFTYLVVLIPGLVGTIVGSNLGTEVSGCVGSALLLLQFLGVFWKAKQASYRAVAMKAKKSELWAAIFVFYLGSNVLLWTASIAAIIVCRNY
uniref:Uncharacterized protein n=1 Tax=Octactis speculum TaxID=3111310 RepID=A0A7S2AYF9_9STRA